MGAMEIVVIVVCVSIVGGVVAGRFAQRKKGGKGGCCGACGSCPGCVLKPDPNKREETAKNARQPAIGKPPRPRKSAPRICP